MSETPQETGEEKVVWERWQKKRTFVRELVGKYGEVYKKLLDQPRVYPSKDFAFKGGPTLFGKMCVNPGNLEITQTIETHIEVFVPGGYGQKHGHMNSAIFYILEGKGHDVHDGERADWETGDAAIVRNGCVHQHFNDGDTPARVLVMKAKPLFLFFHLLFQQTVEWPPTDPMPGYEDFKPVD